MTGWLLHSTVLWQDKRHFSDQVVKAMGVSLRTWESGLPRRPRKMEQLCNNLAAHIRKKLDEFTPESAARSERALERGVRALAKHPMLPPCNVFHHSMGIAGGDRLETMAVALDGVSEGALHGTLPRGELSVAVVKVAEHVAEIPVGRMKPSSGLDPGLDALLLLMAQMDHDLTVPVMGSEGEISSLVGLLIDVPRGAKRRRVQHRLLDIYFALALLEAGDPLPGKLPTVQQIENVLLGGPPISGGQSWVVRWRNGTKALRYEDVQMMIANVGQSTGKDLSWIFRRLYNAAQVWARVEELGPEAVRMAGERYGQWWNALCNQGRVSAPLETPYWAAFNRAGDRTAPPSI